MKIKNNNVLICNCENTMEIDGKKLANACNSSSCEVSTNLCQSELNIVLENMTQSYKNKENVIIGCTQQSKIFSNLAEENKGKRKKGGKRREEEGGEKEGKKRGKKREEGREKEGGEREEKKRGKGEEKGRGRGEGEGR